MTFDATIHLLKIGRPPQSRTDVRNESGKLLPEGQSEERLEAIDSELATLVFCASGNDGDKKRMRRHSQPRWTILARTTIDPGETDPHSLTR